MTVSRPSCSGRNLLTRYHGFDASADPRITEEFAGAAYRFGHSIVSDDTVRLDNNGNLTGPEIELKDAFFLKADQFNALGGADGFRAISGPTPLRPWTLVSSMDCVTSSPIPRPRRT